MFHTLHFPGSVDDEIRKMDFLSANTTNHRRALMFVVSEIWGIFALLVFYRVSLTIYDVIFPPLVGLVVFEFLFRTRKWLSLRTLPLYIVAVFLLGQGLYSLLLPGIAYYLIKVYRQEDWGTQKDGVASGASNEPIGVPEPVTPAIGFSSFVNRYKQQIWGFVGWFVLASLFAIRSFGLITTPATIICLIVFGFSKTRKGLAGGILVAVSLNLVISLVRGLYSNALCFIPFYYTGF